MTMLCLVGLIVSAICVRVARKDNLMLVISVSAFDIFAVLTYVSLYW